MRDTAEPMLFEDLGPVQAPAPAPALGYSVTANLGGDRQLVVQCFVGSDETLSAMHGKFDRAMALIDRQKAKYSIGDLKKERAKLTQELAQGTQDLADVDANFDKAQAGLDIQAGELNRQSEAIFNDAYEKFGGSGRQGVFKPTGHAKANLERIDAAAGQVRDLKAKNEAERAQHRQGFLASQQVRQVRVGLLNDEIAELEALIEGG